MSTLLPNIAPYVPITLVQAVLTRSQTCMEQVFERSAGAVLFADVSQFTSLTEHLARASVEGPEELGRLLNRFFRSMVALIHAEGGEVVKFGGDAVTVLFPVSDEPVGYAVRRAKQAADAMQAAMTEFGDVPTRLGPVTLGLRIGIGAGEVLSILLEGGQERCEYVIAGEALRQSIQAEASVGPGQIGLSPEAETMLWPHALAPRELERTDLTTLPNAGAVEDRLRCFLPRPIRGWLDGELHEWLAVLHPMSVLFLGVQGIDYDRPSAAQQLGGLFGIVLETVHRYEGTLARLSVDDKGTVLLVLFGAPPFAHEDDPVRAVRCALDICRAVECDKGAGLAVLAGAATGHVFAGPVGGPRRREYTAMGSAVNLAARLMRASPPGQVLCDYDTYRSARSTCEFESTAPVRVKGRAGPVRVYQPTGRVSGGRNDAFALTGRRDRVDWDPRTLLGREREVARLASALDAVQQGDNRVLIIQGEAGIGKSRLVVELTRLARERGLAWLAGAGHSAEQQTPYLAWREVLTYYFGLDVISSISDRRAQVQTLFWELAPDQMQYLPLLNDIVSVDVPETQLTANMDPVVRQQRLITVLLALLKAWTREQPLILILDDAHWMDSLSWELVVRMAQMLTMAGAPVLIALALRLLDVRNTGGRYIEALRAMRTTETLSLTTLPPGETIALAATRLGLPADGLPEPVADLVLQRSGGNPFFAQELVYALRDQGLIHVSASSSRPGEAECAISERFDQAARALPETIQGLVLARIDRLPPETQLTLKVASVIGRVFAYRTLRHTLKRYAAITDAALERQLGELAALELTPLDSPAPDLTYRFKHVVTQEVAYQTMLFAQRRAVHRTVAETLETLYASRVEGMVGLLAYHWEQAEQLDRAVQYLVRAGEQAQKVYANGEAVLHYARATALLDRLSVRASVGAEQVALRVAALRGLGQVYFGTGELKEASRLFGEAIALGRSGGLSRSELVRLYHWLGEALLWRGERDEHVAIAQEALILLGDDRETFEAALVNQTLATGYLGSGQWERFRDFTMQTARFLDQLPYSEELRSAYTHIVSVYLTSRNVDEAMRWLGTLEDKAARHHDLAALAEVHLYAGIVRVQTGDLRGGLVRWEQAVELFGELGDTKHESWCYPNMSEVALALGDLARAEVCARRAVQKAEAVQIADHVRFARGGKGCVALCQGDHQGAVDEFARCAQLSQAAGDSVREGWAHASLGFVYLAWGRPDEARRHLEKAVTLAGAEGWKRSPLRLALALSGLERIEDAVRLRALCSCLVDGHMEKWLLRPANGGTGGQENLSNGLTRQDLLAEGICSAWEWLDPLGDCRFRADGGLRIWAANGRDLAGSNQSAPRLLLDASGDVAIQAVCRAASDDRPAIGGILSWGDRENYMLLEWGRRGPREIALSGCQGGRPVLMGRGLLPSSHGGRAPDRVFLRMYRRGGLARALCSADGKHWFRVGETVSHAEGPAQVGPCAIGAIDRLVYPGAYRNGAAIEFESFVVWSG